MDPRRQQIDAASDGNVGHAIAEREQASPLAHHAVDPEPDTDLRRVLETALGDRYAIRRTLGKGGMGAVYLVLDRQHDRPLALKVLLPEVAAALGANRDAERFLREIRISAHLSHPHIVALYDSGQANGLLYYTMPYVPGESLRNRLRRDGPLPLQETITLARQVASALDYAHRQGVVHRDVKPENILLHEGEALVADFGIARALHARRQDATSQVAPAVDGPCGGDDAPAESDGPSSAAFALGDQITLAGSALGTPLYMSPEQAVGEVVDDRSDIYALGCVVYEMLAGEPPFTGANTNVILARKLVGDVPPLGARRGGLPAGLDGVLRRGLCPASSDRFASAQELVEALELAANAAVIQPPPRRARRLTLTNALAAAAITALAIAVPLATRAPDAARRGAPPTIRTIAVLPIDSDSSHGSVAADLHARLVNELASINALRVTGVASSMRYRGVAKPPTVVARELRVDGLVESSLTVGHDSLALQVRIRGGRAAEVLWTREYATDMRRLERLQKEVIRDVITYLRLPLSAKESGRLARFRVIDPRANEAYQRGRVMSASFDPDRFRRSIAAFEDAIRIDPDDPTYYVALAEVYETMVGAGHATMDPAEAFRLAKEALQRAFELDPDNAEAHVILGGIHDFWDWDWDGAEREFRLALRNSPGSARAHFHYGAYLQSIGLIDSAVVELRLAEKLDPLSPIILGQLAWAHLWAGNPDSTFYWTRRALDLEPNFAPARWILGSAYLAKGQYDSAITVNRRAAETTPHFRIRLAVAYAAAGRRREYDRTMALLTPSQRIWTVLRASPYIGNRDVTIRTMAAAIDAHLPWISQIRGDPAYEHLVPDPRYQALLKRIGLPPREPATASRRAATPG
jgi:serine/threonine-protein kinase